MAEAKVDQLVALMVDLTVGLMELLWADQLVALKAFLMVGLMEL